MREPDQDADNAEPGVEADPRFPSGPWTGFWLERTHFSGPQWMELDLRFREGRIRGHGRDRIAEFVMRGSYDIEEGKCTIFKQYVGLHAVIYNGYNEGKGIWGTWVIPPELKGGFHIWPLGMDDPTQARLREALEQPVEDEVLVEEFAGTTT